MKPQANRRKMMSLPHADEIKGKWKQQIGAAKVAWGKLTEDELLQLEGHQQKLAGLIQERYAITRNEAEKQVQQFFDKQQF
ncbi:MAG: CsbD family protein [Porticoccaceae bacterium]